MMMKVDVGVKIVPKLVQKEDKKENGMEIFEKKQNQILEFTVCYFVPIVYILFTIAYFMFYNYF